MARRIDDNAWISSQELKLLSLNYQPEDTEQTVVRLSTQIAKETRGDAFGKFATAASGWWGSKWAFLAAILVIVIWAATGSLFHYSDTWQVVINTGITIVTFLMVFLIQNTQNRDARSS